MSFGADESCAVTESHVTLIRTVRAENCFYVFFKKIELSVFLSSFSTDTIVIINTGAQYGRGSWEDPLDFCCYKSTADPNLSTRIMMFIYIYIFKKISYFCHWKIGIWETWANCLIYLIIILLFSAKKLNYFSCPWLIFISPVPCFCHKSAHMCPLWLAPKRWF